MITEFKPLITLYEIYIQRRRELGFCSFYDCENKINLKIPKFGMNNQSFLICDKCYAKYKIDQSLSKT